MNGKVFKWVVNSFDYTSMRLFFSELIFIFFFLVIPNKKAEAQVTILRSVPPTSEIFLPDTLSSSSCPSNLLPGHVTICGSVRTIDVNYSNGVEYVQQPIKGATIAVYLGARYAPNIPDSFNFVKADPNSTGEIAGKIDGLYMYNVTNADGRYILAAPRGVGTAGMAFVAFFCGDYLKDLYMVDTSKDIGFLPVSLACPPEVTPAMHDESLSGNLYIPAPPSVVYARRSSYTSCENAQEVGEIGKENQVAPNNVSIPIEKKGLDDTRNGALVTQEFHATCLDDEPGEVINNCWSYPGEGTFCDPEGYQPPQGTKPCCYYEGVHLSCTGKSSYWLAQGEDVAVCAPYTSTTGYHLSPITSDPIVFELSSDGKQVPSHNSVLSRRDLEGFTHSSIAYSLNAISSLNCGVSGCYDTSPPAKGIDTNLTFERSVVKACNVAPIPELNCYGPGILLGEPAWYRTSYETQQDVRIFNGGARIGDVVPPYYSLIGQLIQTGDLDFLTGKNFPYSALLNYKIGYKIPYNFENRPSNDSYRNTLGGSTEFCISDETYRLTDSYHNPGESPFKACYRASFPAQDAYSMQKALFTTTRNTNTALQNQDVVYPVTQKFVAPGEQVGDEVSPKDDSIPSGVMNTPKIGKGYWRIGIVDTLCNAGMGDDDPVDWPVMAAYGAD